MYRQGDVLLVPVDAIPTPAGRLDGPVLLYPGQTSRQGHAVTGDRIEAWLSRGDRYLRVDGEATMTHPEHSALAVPSGTYRVVRQREYPDDRPTPTYSIHFGE